MRYYQRRSKIFESIRVLEAYDIIFHMCTPKSYMKIEEIENIMIFEYI